MKTTKFTLSVLFNLVYLFSFSQSEFVVEINRTTDSFTKTGLGIAGMTFLYPDDGALDETNGTFFFQSSDAYRPLFSINVSNDSVLSNPIINNIQTFQFDNTSNILYALQIDNINNLKNFISINPVTASFIQIGSSLPNSSAYSGAFSAFNKINHTFIFWDPTNMLYSINAISGNVISNPNLSLASGESISSFSFNNTTGILYGLLQDNNVGKYFLVKINPLTGTYTRIGLGEGSTSLEAAFGSTIDESNQQYIYLYTNSTGYNIATLDIATGNIINNALIEAFNLNDNFNSLKYDNINGKLYALHWETITTQISESNNFDKTVSASPNPFNQFTILKFNNSNKKNCTLTLYDLRGQVVRTINNIITDKVEIERQSLASGLYFFQLRTDEQIIANGKLTIE